MADPDTGLVRFGYRDYDPTVGRFTAPDPLGDTGGDHDLYDYCIDDPINLNDPSGLYARALAAAAQYAGGKLFATGLAATGLAVAANGADAIVNFFSGTDNSTVADNVYKVAPTALKIIGTNALVAPLPVLVTKAATVANFVRGGGIWNRLS